MNEENEKEEVAEIIEIIKPKKVTKSKINLPEAQDGATLYNIIKNGTVSLDDIGIQSGKLIEPVGSYEEESTGLTDEVLLESLKDFGSHSKYQTFLEIQDAVISKVWEKNDLSKVLRIKAFKNRLNRILSFFKIKYCISTSKQDIIISQSIGDTMLGIAGLDDEAIERIDKIIEKSGSIEAFRKSTGFWFKVDGEALDNSLIEIIKRRNKLSKLLHWV